jgi:uncharacterized heparinase superfamily protein
VTSAATLWRTVRHLRAEQLIGRAWFRVARPRPDPRPAPPRRVWRGTWAATAEHTASLVGPFQLRLLNEEYDIERQGWDDPGASKLLRYNVHYFEDLVAHDAVSRGEMQRALIERWIGENPAGLGTGWEPYPLSLRLVNWLKWFLAGEQPRAHWLDSLAVQTRWLSRRLEYHLLGNHLFVNAKALVFAGAFFDGPEADRWLETGMKILERQIPEQILADGGQFELSPMYHALALEDVLDLANLCAGVGVELPGLGTLERELRGRAKPMLSWLRAMTHPDGSLGLFNDCAPGIAPPVANIERYAARLGITADERGGAGIHHLAPSGYVRANWDGANALLDVARVGPDYLPGHAHADTLSFELSIHGRRVLLNCGTSRYGVGEERLRERGTRAHNTVEVDGCDSSEVWSGFRVGRRALPVAVEVGGDFVVAAHDGYRFLRGKPLHRRRWSFSAQSLCVEDEVSPAPRSAVARYHLAPGLSLLRESDSRWRIVEGANPICSIEILEGAARKESSRHAAGFGITVPTECLAVQLPSGRGSTRWAWTQDAHTFSH